MKETEKFPSNVVAKWNAMPRTIGRLWDASSRKIVWNKAFCETQLQNGFGRFRAIT